MHNLHIERRRNLPEAFVSEVPLLARHYLSHPKALIFVASVDDQDIGFVLASVEDATRSSDIEAMAVIDSFQQRGIAGQLLKALEDALMERQCLVVTKLYEASKSTTPALEAVVASRGWKAPQRFLRRYHFHVPTFAPAWFQVTYPLPSGFEIISWTQVTEQERKHIHHQYKQGTFPAMVYPLGHDVELIEPMNSLALRHRGELIGWMVTHRVAADTIRYAYFYVEDSVRHQGISVRMLIDAIRLQQTSDIPKATFEIREARIDPQWKRFIIKRLAPYAEDKSEVRMVWKDLRGTEIAT